MTRIMKLISVAFSMMSLIICCSTSQVLLAKGSGKQHLITSKSRTQTASRKLGLYGVPAYALIGGKHVSGTYISKLVRGSAASQAGLRAGDVLLTINDHVIKTPSSADRIIESLLGNNARIQYARRNGNRLVLLKKNAQWQHLQKVSANGLSSRSYSERAPASARDRGKASIAELERYLFTLVNQDRVANKLPRVRTSSRLSKLARAFADDMNRRNFYGHVDPDGNNPLARAQKAGINKHIAENICRMYDSHGTHMSMVKTCQDTMMREPANNPTNHRGQILDPSHKVLGVGVAIRRDGGVLVVQEFSRDNIP